VEKYAKILDRLGMKMSLKGYTYWKEALYYADNLAIADDMIKMGNIYRYIAKKYDDSYNRVERALRHAIDTTDNMRDTIRTKFNLTYNPNNTHVLMCLIRWINEEEFN